MATTNIFTFGGNVGVGTNNTTYKFEVYSGTSKLETLEADSLVLSDTTDSTTTANGAMTIAGGLGVGFKMYTLNTYVAGKVGVAKTAVADFDVNGTISATSLKIGSITDAFVPQGLIAMWSGTDGNVPDGWGLCDGTNAQPDLRAKFIIGAGSTYAVGATGGSTQVTLSEANLPAHAHTGDSGSAGASAHAIDTGNAGGHAHTDTTGNYDHTHTTSTPNHVHAHSGNSDTNNHNHAFQQGAHAHTNTCANAYNFGGINRHNGVPAGASGGWIVGASAGAYANGGGDHAHSFNTGDQGSHEHAYTTSTYSTNHAHEFTTSTIAQHTHASGGSSSSGGHPHTISTQATGQGQAFQILPVYYALAFIRKS